MAIDWGRLGELTGSVLGGGAAATIIGRLLGYRKSREESTDERLFRLVDEVQAQLRDEREATDRLRDRLDTQANELATLQAQDQQAQAARARMHEQYEQFRQQADARVADLEAQLATALERLRAYEDLVREHGELKAEVGRLRALLEANGITDDGRRHGI